MLKMLLAMSVHTVYTLWDSFVFVCGFSPYIFDTFQVLFDLGHMLHQPQYSSGSWEMVAEELGYDHEDIKRFATTATVYQRGTPGEQMLRDWVDRANGCTLFVLCNALENIGRKDCMEHLKKEIYSMYYLIILLRVDSRGWDQLIITLYGEKKCVEKSPLIFL